MFGEMEKKRRANLEALGELKKLMGGMEADEMKGKKVGVAMSMEGSPGHEESESPEEESAEESICGCGKAECPECEAELHKGIETEMKEHGMSEEEARKTASDHLKEDPHYYAKLEKAGIDGEDADLEEEYGKMG